MVSIGGKSPKINTVMRGPERSNLWVTDNATEGLAPPTTIGAKFRRRGFLPEEDPLIAFPANSEFAERPLITHHLTSASAVPPIPLYLNRSTCAEVP